MTLNLFPLFSKTSCFFLVCPSLIFWTCAGGLHLLGVNKSYRGYITVKQMILTQFTIDIFQFISAFSHFYLDNSLVIRFWALCLGALAIEFIEYMIHRYYHYHLYNVHAQHHKLIGVHTLGTFYNDIRETLITGTLLGLGLVGVLGLTVPEVSILSSIGTVFTIWDHWPSSSLNSSSNSSLSSSLTITRSRHEIHHTTGKSDFCQPFSPLFDIIFKTRQQDL